jgi:DnaJ-class molecular chaperone
MTSFTTTLCPTCEGKGYTMEYPKLAFNLGEKVKKQCASCHGIGEILFIPPKLRVITDSEVEPKIEIKFKVNITKGE